MPPRARRVDPDSPAPPYRQVAGFLRADLPEPGGKLPSVEQICARYKVARATARKAVRVLADEGLVEVTPGWGTFARRPPA